jgi:hypothetical protein
VALDPPDHLGREDVGDGACPVLPSFERLAILSRLASVWWPVTRSRAKTLRGDGDLDSEWEPPDALANILRGLG